MTVDSRLRSLLALARQISGSVPCDEVGCRTGCEPGHGTNELLLLPGEREYIEERLDEPLKFDKREYPGLGEITVQSEPCPYLTDDHLCSIYAERPLDCRTYPLILHVGHVSRDNVRMRFAIDPACPASEHPETKRHASRWVEWWMRAEAFIRDHTDWLLGPWEDFDLGPGCDAYDRIAKEGEEILRDMPATEGEREDRGKCSRRPRLVEIGKPPRGATPPRRTSSTI